MRVADLQVIQFAGYAHRDIITQCLSRNAADKRCGISDTGNLEKLSALGDTERSDAVITATDKCVPFPCVPVARPLDLSAIRAVQPGQRCYWPTFGGLQIKRKIEYTIVGHRVQSECKCVRSQCSLSINDGPAVTQDNRSIESKHLLFCCRNPRCNCKIADDQVIYGNRDFRQQRAVRIFTLIRDAQQAPACNVDQSQPQFRTAFAVIQPKKTGDVRMERTNHNVRQTGSQIPQQVRIDFHPVYDEVQFRLTSASSICRAFDECPDNDI